MAVAVELDDPEMEANSNDDGNRSGSDCSFRSENVISVPVLITARSDSGVINRGKILKSLDQRKKKETLESPIRKGKRVRK